MNKPRSDSKTDFYKSLSIKPLSGERRRKVVSEMVRLIELGEKLRNPSTK